MNDPPSDDDELLELDLSELDEIEGEFLDMIVAAKERAEEWEAVHAELCKAKHDCELDGCEEHMLPIFSYRRIFFESGDEEVLVCCDLCGEAQVVAQTCPDCGGYEVLREPSN